MVKLLKVIISQTGGPDLAMLPDGHFSPIARTSYQIWRFRLLYGSCVYYPKDVERNDALVAKHKAEM